MTVHMSVDREFDLGMVGGGCSKRLFDQIVQIVFSVVSVYSFHQCVRTFPSFLSQGVLGQMSRLSVF